MSDTYDAETGEIAPHMPPAIAEAIIAVKKQVKQLGSDEKNQHGGYGYVSVDKFYDVIGKLMASAGLALLIDETSADVREGGKGNPWLFTRYDCRFMHESGAMGPAMRRSCALPVSGPQAFGAAQSYIEKQLLRQVFKIPTGEKDADDVAQTDAPAPRTAQGTATGHAGARQDAPAAQRPQNAANGAIDENLKQRHRELAAVIADTQSIPDVVEVPKMLAWSTYRGLLQEHKGEKVAAETMKLLEDRIERRRQSLDAGQDYEV